WGGARFGAGFKLASGQRHAGWPHGQFKIDFDSRTVALVLAEDEVFRPPVTPESWGFWFEGADLPGHWASALASKMVVLLVQPWFASTPWRELAALRRPVLCLSYSNWVDGQ